MTPNDCINAAALVIANTLRLRMNMPLLIDLDHGDAAPMADHYRAAATAALSIPTHGTVLPSGRVVASASEVSHDE